jgi:hypothetical protein
MANNNTKNNIKFNKQLQSLFNENILDEFINIYIMLSVFYTIKII